MALHHAALDVDRLVLDEQPDDLAVGDVDDRLPVLGEAVAALAVLQRVALVEAVEVGAAGARAARPRRGCRAGRGGRWPARTATRRGRGAPVDVRLAQPPRLRRVEDVGQAASSSCSGRRRRRRRRARAAPASRPCGRRRRRGRSARRGRPPRRRGRPRAPRRATRRTPRSAAAARNVSGAGLPGSRSAAMRTPSTQASNRPSMPADASASRAFALEETSAERRRRAGRVQQLDRVAVGLDALAADELQHEVVLAPADAVDGLCLGRVVRGALGERRCRGARGSRGRRPGGCCRRRGAA